MIDCTDWLKEREHGFVCYHFFWGIFYALPLRIWNFNATGLPDLGFLVGNLIASVYSFCGYSQGVPHISLRIFGALFNRFIQSLLPIFWPTLPIPSAWNLWFTSNILPPFRNRFDPSVYRALLTLLICLIPWLLETRTHHKDLAHRDLVHGLACTFLTDLISSADTDEYESLSVFQVRDFFGAQLLEPPFRWLRKCCNTFILTGGNDDMTLGNWLFDKLLEFL